MEELERLPGHVRADIERQGELAGEAEMLIEIGLAKAEETPKFTKEEEQNPHVPDWKTTRVHASMEGDGFEWVINYTKLPTGSEELRAHKLFNTPGQRGADHYSVFVTRGESMVEFPNRGVNVTVLRGSYHYQEAGAGTQYISGWNSPRISEKIRGFFSSLNDPVRASAPRVES